MTLKSFSVRIFLQDGHADGVKIVSKSKWSGRGLVIPRSSFAKEKDREELNAPGIYLLVRSAADKELPTICIGGAEKVCDALQQHDCQTVFWNWALIFTDKESRLETKHVQYLEYRLRQMAREAKKSHLDGLHDPLCPELSATELADAEVFLAHMLSLYPLLGQAVFARVEREESRQ